MSTPGYEPEDLPLYTRVSLEIRGFEHRGYFPAVYWGTLPMRDVFENAKGLDLPILDLEEIEQRNLPLAISLRRAIEMGAETPIFKLDSGEEVYGVQCSWEVVTEKRVLH